MISSACPYSGYLTLDANDRGSYDICPICYWEDDPTQISNPDFVSGANCVSLRQAQENFVTFGASEHEVLKHVRKPYVNELRDAEWRLVELNYRTYKSATQQTLHSSTGLWFKKEILHELPHNKKNRRRYFRN